ncbi:MAG: hypothetical protein IPK19_24515 [Chloroflexi bacterium]|nr:hypothetical protein [Chloroflexota bacterium]
MASAARTPTRNGRIPRTGLFALTLFDYYHATGKVEYFERAVAAQRSCFALLYVPENAITGNYLRHKKLQSSQGR